MVGRGWWEGKGGGTGKKLMECSGVVDVWKKWSIGRCREEGGEG